MPGFSGCMRLGSVLFCILFFEAGFRISHSIRVMVGTVASFCARLSTCLLLNFSDLLSAGSGAPATEVASNR